jgi:hypothetical protein
VNIDGQSDDVFGEGLMLQHVVNSGAGSWCSVFSVQMLSKE